MKRLINKIKLFPNDNEKSKEIEKTLTERLELANFEIVDSKYDLAIAIGGDDIQPADGHRRMAFCQRTVHDGIRCHCQHRMESMESRE